MTAPATSGATATLPAGYAEDARTLIAQFGADAGHSRRVAAHAAQLLEGAIGAFDHPDRQAAYALALLLAASLHDIGRSVRVRDHHRHSRYLIRHSVRTEGWPDDLRATVAALSFVHRRRAKDSWLRKHLRGDRDGLRLGALLRLADGLDRSHMGGIEIVRFGRRGRDWELIVRGLWNRDAERLCERKADLFALAFGRRLRLRVELA